MFADSRSKQHGDACAGRRSVQTPALPGYAALILSDADGVKEMPVQGAIGARIEAVDPHDYRATSDALIRGVPVPAGPSLPPPRHPSRARDLIAEVHHINAQVQRIMAQVDRSVARLATQRLARDPFSQSTAPR